MRIRPHELHQQLSRGLRPIYLITGDEPLQMNEVADTIRAHARDQGYSEREVMEAGAKFDWNSLAAEANALSLFATQRIIDLRLASSKPGTEGTKALVAYAENPPPDTLLLISLPKLDSRQLGNKWVKSLESAGALIQVWPVDTGRLPGWIDERMRRQGLIPDRSVVGLLAERVEGNLLAAAQEIDKLLLLNGPGAVSAEQLVASVSDSARYDVFGLVDSALAGKVAHCVRVLNGLRAEGTPAPVILWALTRETRLLYGLAQEVDRGRTPQQVISGRREIWEKRRPLVAKGLQRLRTGHWRRLLQLCGETDRAIKGQLRRDPWQLLQTIATRIAGAPAL